MTNQIHFRLKNCEGPVRSAVLALFYRRYVPISIAIILAGSLLSVVLSLNGHSLPNYLTNALVAFGFIIVGSAAALYSAQSKTVWTIAGDAASLDCNFDDQGVHLRAADSEISSPWRAFSGFTETREAFVLLATTYPILVVPKSDIGAAQSVSTVRAALKAHVRAV